MSYVRYTTMITPGTPPGAPTEKNYYLGGLSCAARLTRGIGWITAILLLVIRHVIQAK